VGSQRQKPDVRSRNAPGEDSDTKSEIQNPKWKGYPSLRSLPALFASSARKSWRQAATTWSSNLFRRTRSLRRWAGFLDIEYIYEPESEAAPARKVPEVELTAAMLADLPAELLQELRETTLTLNREAALEVIAARIKEPLTRWPAAETWGRQTEARFSVPRSGFPPALRRASARRAGVRCQDKERLRVSGRGRYQDGWNGVLE
jgi:hypothetical protein